MLTLIRDADVYAPQPLGRQSLLLVGGRIGKIGDIDPRAVEALDVECNIVDAAGLTAIPGLIDPHQHLLGGSGEEGFSSQTPEFFISEIVAHGITTVVGVLGVDTTMKTMPGLLAKTKGLREQGMNAFAWTGGYSMPPVSVMGSVRNDMLFIDEIIGAGEIAIADRRAEEPTAHELARLASECYNGCRLSRKAGVVHLHVGEAERRLSLLREVLANFDVEPSWFYPTHVERSEPLMREAIALTTRGMYVDIDTVEEDLPKWLRFYVNHGGDLCCLTVSSDAAVNSPRTVWEQLRTCVLEDGFPLEKVLPLATSNTARVLKLQDTGTLGNGCWGDIVLLDSHSLEIEHVFCKGVPMVEHRDVIVREPFLKQTNRRIELVGAKLREADA